MCTSQSLLGEKSVMKFFCNIFFSHYHKISIAIVLLSFIMCIYYMWFICLSVYMCTCATGTQWSEESVTTTTWISQLSTPALGCGTASFSSWEESSMSVCSWSSSKGVLHIPNFICWSILIFKVQFFNHFEFPFILVAFCHIEKCFKLSCNNRKLYGTAGCF